MAFVRDEDVDSELVINEIEKRPTLFNKTLKDYSVVELVVCDEEHEGTEDIPKATGHSSST